MSVQLGRWNTDGQPVDPSYLQKAKDMLAPYGPDGEGAYIKDSVGILYRAFHTTNESRKESQPLVTSSGTVICWVGRLDNRHELIRELPAAVTIAATDLAVVAAAYEAWGTKCLAMLIGDWALSVWDSQNRSLILAKDPIGTQHLYYSFDDEQVIWSSILDPLVLLAGKTFALEEEYIAGWLSFFPATHLTPYIGIHSVPPSCFVRLATTDRSIHKYWDFDPRKRVRYRTDGEYEEHFRQVFGESVRRRLRSDSPVLAELSGGMDSSSIVCMADTIIARGGAETPRLDTISYYDDSEPNWNERPYFTRVEEKRDRTGSHIDVGGRDSFTFGFDGKSFWATPGADNGHLNETAKRFAACMTSQGNRVVLSGIGGDEVTGGVPTPAPELENLLARANFRTLARQLKVWALDKRKPWFYLLLEAARSFLAPRLAGVPKHKRPAPWLDPKFVKRQRASLGGYETRVKLFGPLPSFQEQVSTLEALQRQLGCDALPSHWPYEKRYPYLDRNFLEFLCAIPREQLVRPGQRRSLMRRALAGIVPDELLNRRRKAYISRGPMAEISRDFEHYAGFTRRMVGSSVGIVNGNDFLEALQKVRCGQEVPIVTVMRTLRIENWLRQLADSKLLRLIARANDDRRVGEEGTARAH